LVFADAVIFNGITEFTFTIIVDSLAHPVAAIPVTVYSIVELGLAITFAPVIVFKPNEGVQV
jgi:hypothetical protein